MDSLEYQPKETLYVVETDVNSQCKKYKCLLCDRFLSSKQRVLSHLHTAHRRSPLKRVKKRYLDNPGLPIPKRTLYRKEARGNKSAGQEKDESFTVVGEQQHTEALDVNEDVLTPDPAQDHDESFQDCIEIEELIQNENGGPEDLISRTINTYFSVNSEGTNHESDIDSESDDSLNFSTESSSENELSESSSSEDNNSESDEEQIETQCHQRDYQSFTVLQLQSLAIIAFLLRHNLTGVAVNDLISLLKVIYPDSSLGSMKYEELFQVIDKVNFKKLVITFLKLMRHRIL